MLVLMISSILAFSSSPDFSSCSMYPILNEKISSLKCQNLNQEYLMGFGMKYCLRFMTAGLLVENEIGKINWNSTSEIKKAQKLLKFRNWVWGTMKCLQNDISSYIEDSHELTCSSIRQRAFNSHRKCYETNGFCEIYPFWDDIVFKIIGFNELVKMLPQSRQMLGICTRK